MLWLGPGDYTGSCPPSAQSINLTQAYDGSFALASLKLTNVTTNVTGRNVSVIQDNQTQVFLKLYSDSAMLVAPNFVGLGLPQAEWTKVKNQLKTLVPGLETSTELSSSWMWV